MERSAASVVSTPFGVGVGKRFPGLNGRRDSLRFARKLCLFVDAVTHAEQWCDATMACSHHSAKEEAVSGSCPKRRAPEVHFARWDFLSGMLQAAELPYRDSVS